MLGGISLMDIRRYELVSAPPFVFDNTSKFSTDFIVKDLKVDFVATIAKTLHG